jgi:predicted anti-sigma-YlaC factor YlaD
MVVSCEDVWREISNYLDGEIDTTLRTAIEEHLKGCKRCSAVLDGTRNIIRLYGDERMTELPPGFSDRLAQRLSANEIGRRGFSGWIVTAAAAVVTIGVFEAGRFFSSGKPELRSEHAQPGTGIPPGMMVVISVDGKTLHVPGCRFIHDKVVRTVAASVAIQEGYTPCVRCMKEFLRA